MVIIEAFGDVRELFSFFLSHLVILCILLVSEVEEKVYSEEGMGVRIVHRMPKESGFISSPYLLLLWSLLLSHLTSRYSTSGYSIASACRVITWS
jgi:hypothetical protein